MKISRTMSTSRILGDLFAIRQKKIRIQNIFEDIVFTLVVKKSGKNIKKFA